MRLTDKALKTEFLATCERLYDGQLTLRTPEGERYNFGNTGDHAEMIIRDWSAVSAMAAHGQIGLGEAYVQGLWETPSVDGLMAMAMRNRDQLSGYDQASLFNKAKFRLVDTVLRANSRRGSRKNIRSHYDVGNEFYQLWLDDGMTYSSGLFDTHDDDLGVAQHRKNTRALSRLSAGERVLEIGCGWGGFAEHAATEGRDVTGITISRNQFGYADSRLDGRAEILFCDYRDVNEKFDNIVSIEMIEAVGMKYWPSYFSTLKSNLAKDGRVLLQAITVNDDYFDTYKTQSDYIRQYVFPGGMLLSNKVIAEQAKAAGFKVMDNFAFGQDYAKTCRIWAKELVAKKNKIHALGFDTAFFRNWQYYLEICAASFAIGHTNVVQVELAHA
ncbi:cyclopropane-fatty-acyl-phospholipid synthase [Amylibacter kogurei]|uniref:Cyclopropane-fatty-acyl-phospholipid synthase n=1 Tax=Paramylibacter kogurei TaxID=1889778 RepID=A0A2G5K7V1_9RHOB|nr:cyclopropane-fatty-acyl-phospholipid synthase family protein [Amylibacter kogurei]PIB25608.1 cyclopropane-fatty-acyl-phospholipid synthase [Amylibacter kogurei]